MKRCKVCGIYARDLTASGECPDSERCRAVERQRAEPPPPKPVENPLTDEDREPSE